MVFYLTQFYRRNELALRIALFYGAATIAGAFSGLLAFGVFQINDKSVKGWMYLFIIEGGASVLIALFAYWHLPKNAETCKWLSEEEKAVAKQRILLDGSVETNEKFDIKVALRVLFTPRIAIWTLLGFSYGVGKTLISSLQSLSLHRSHPRSLCLSWKLPSPDGAATGRPLLLSEPTLAPLLISSPGLRQSEN